MSDHFFRVGVNTSGICGTENTLPRVSLVAREIGMTENPYQVETKPHLPLAVFRIVATAASADFQAYSL